MSPRSVSIKSANFVAIPAGTKLYRFNTRNTDTHYARYKDDFLDKKGVPRGQCWQELDMPREFMLSLQGNSVWDSSEEGDHCITEYTLYRSVVAANRFYTNDEIHRGTAGHFDVVLNDHDDSIELAFLRQASDYVKVVRDIPREEYDAVPDRKYLRQPGGVQTDITFMYTIMAEAARVARFNTFDTFSDAHRYLWTLTDMYGEGSKPVFKFSKYPLIFRMLWGICDWNYGVIGKEKAYENCKKTYDIFVKYHGDDDDFYVPILKQAFETKIRPKEHADDFLMPMDYDIIKYNKHETPDLDYQ